MAEGREREGGREEEGKVNLHCACMSGWHVHVFGGSLEGDPASRALL